MRKIIYILLILTFAACHNTELITEHSNPLDRIFDDGDFRIVLSQPEKQADGTWLIRWSNVFHKTEGELDDQVFMLNAGAVLASMNSAPTAADLQAIRNNSLDHNFDTDILYIQAKKGSYAGSHNLGTLSGVTIRSYVIYMSYYYIDPNKDNQKTSGIIHSNVVVFRQ